MLAARERVALARGRQIDGRSHDRRRHHGCGRDWRCRGRRGVRRRGVGRRDHRLGQRRLVRGGRGAERRLERGCGRAVAGVVQLVVVVGVIPVPVVGIDHVVGCEPLLGRLDIGSGVGRVDAPLAVGSGLAVGVGEILQPLQPVFLGDLRIPGLDRIGSVPLGLVVEIHPDDVDVLVSRIGRRRVHAEVAEVHVPLELELARHRAEYIDELLVSLDEVLFLPLGRVGHGGQIELLTDAHVDLAASGIGRRQFLRRLEIVRVVLPRRSLGQVSSLDEHGNAPRQLGVEAAHVVDQAGYAVGPIEPVGPTDVWRDPIHGLSHPRLERLNSGRVIPRIDPKR